MRLVLTALNVVLGLILTFSATAQQIEADKIETEEGYFTVQPIQHGTLVLRWNENTVYIDPTGGAEAFEGLNSPDVILITHAHGDHMNIETLQALDTEGVDMIVPQSVADELPNEYNDQLIILDNGETTDLHEIEIRTVPMYNLPDDETSRHPKGWGNGYTLTFGSKKVYISGDTEGVDEMRSLENIHVAFVCMNLPYTMDVNQATDAVLDFEPQIVYPYHYRGQDIQKFKQLVNENTNEIKVRLRDWYPNN